jgi:hypothetical protein
MADTPFPLRAGTRRHEGVERDPPGLFRLEVGLALSSGPAIPSVKPEV